MQQIFSTTIFQLEKQLNIFNPSNIYFFNAVKNIFNINKCFLEPSGHELRQAVPLAASVLQEGDHEEDGAEPAAGVSVLPPLSPLT